MIDSALSYNSVELALNIDGAQQLTGTAVNVCARSTLHASA